MHDAVDFYGRSVVGLGCLIVLLVVWDERDVTTALATIFYIYRVSCCPVSRFVSDNDRQRIVMENGERGRICFKSSMKICICRIDKLTNFRFDSSRWNTLYRDTFRVYT